MSQVKLGSVANITQGGRLKFTGKNFVQKGFPAYGAGGINGYLQEHEFDKDGVVLSANGARCGKCFYAQGKWTSLANTQIILPDISKANPKFLWYQLNDERKWRRAGTAQPFIKPSDVKNKEIFLPEIKEQNRIVDILDVADDLRQKRKQSLRLLDEFLRAVFLDMFGDPIHMSHRFTRKRIGDLGEVITGNTPSRLKSEYYGNHIEWIKSDNINTPQFILTKAKEYLSLTGLKAGRLAPKWSVLVTCIAGSPECIGNVAMTDRDVAFNQQINAFVPGKEISQKVFFAQIHFFKKLIQQASTNSMKGMVSKSKFSEIEVLVPTKDLQRKFDEIFDKVSFVRLQSQQSETELENQFNALTQRYFS